MNVSLTSAQEEAIKDIDKSMLVVAGAGSGKTLVLVRRFVEILQKQPELNVRNLLAVTYTRKAAKEMRTRIKARLKELYEKAKADNTSEQMRWHQCLADMDLAYIDTIHSLCQSVLRSFTIEIGLDPEIEVMDEIERAQIMQESIDDTFRESIAASSSHRELLEHFPLETLESFLQLILKSHLQFAEIACELENLNTNELMLAMEVLLTRIQKQLLTDLITDEDWYQAGAHLKNSSFAEASSKLEDVRLQVAQYVEHLQTCFHTSDQDENLSLDQSRIKEAWQIILDLANFGAIRVGGNTDTAKEMRSAIKTLVEKCKDCLQSNKKGYKLPLLFHEESNGEGNQYWVLWRALLDLAKQAKSIYAAKKMALGKLDFDDLIGKTKAILQEPNSSVRAYYNKELLHILVDEFQDTNPVQAEIITLLAGANSKLFLIGDDKQSIYKFQGADLSTFNSWRRKNIHTLAFAHSFRSRPGIVDFVNAVFSNLLPAHKAHVDYRAKYSALRSRNDFADSASATNAPSVEIIHLPKNPTEEQEAKNNEIAKTFSSELIEGRLVANWIYDKVKNKSEIADKAGNSKEIKYGDFAILTARNSDLQIFESCLSEKGIPYVTSGGRTFLDRQEIYDLENMLRFLSNISDSHALLAILRSPMFAVSDEIIHNLVSPNALSLWQELQDSLWKRSAHKDIGYQPIAEAVVVLKRLLADLAVLSLSELIYRIIRDTNYDLIALTLPDGRQRYKNIWKFYMLAKDEYDAAQFADRLELARQLSITETNAAIDNKQSVKLMTIHAAKGLEFPAVALPALSNSGTYNKSKLLFHQQFGIVLNTSRTDQERDEGVPIPYQLGKTLDDDMDLAEKKRLFYVAMTRARDYLALFIDDNEFNNKAAAGWLNPILDKLGTSVDVLHKTDTADLMREANQTKGDWANSAQESAVAREETSADINRMEQLLEPLAINLGTAVSSLPEASLFYRITPSAKHCDPSPILVGKFFHRIMEYLPQNKPELEESELVALLEQFADEAVHPAFRHALIDEGKKLLALYASSKFHEIFSKAKTICHEWSYYMHSEDQQLTLNRPDLLLETKGGLWYIIDYKTDRFAPNDIQQQAFRHRPQLQRYSRDFKLLTNIEPRLAVYFAQVGTLHEYI